METLIILVRLGFRLWVWLKNNLIASLKLSLAAHVLMIYKKYAFMFRVCSLKIIAIFVFLLSFIIPARSTIYTRSLGRIYAGFHCSSYLQCLVNAKFSKHSFLIMWSRNFDCLFLILIAPFFSIFPKTF